MIDFLLVAGGLTVAMYAVTGLFWLLFFRGYNPEGEENE